MASASRTILWLKLSRSSKLISDPLLNIFNNKSVSLVLLNVRLNVGYMVRSHHFFLFKWVLDSLVSFKFWVRSLMILLTADTSVKYNPSNDSTLTLELRVHFYDFWFYLRTNVFDSQVFINRFISSTIFFLSPRLRCCPSLWEVGTTRRSCLLLIYLQFQIFSSHFR